DQKEGLRDELEREADRNQRDNDQVLNASAVCLFGAGKFRCHLYRSSAVHFSERAVCAPDGRTSARRNSADRVKYYENTLQERQSLIEAVSGFCPTYFREYEIALPPVRSYREQSIGASGKARFERCSHGCRLGYLPWLAHDELVNVHHQCHCEQRGCEIDDRNGDETGDEQTGHEYGAVVALA